MSTARLVNCTPWIVRFAEVDRPFSGHPPVSFTARLRPAFGTVESCCLAIALGACVSANTPLQNLAYERWSKCAVAYVKLDRISLDGRITFQVTSYSDRQAVVQCLAEAGRTGPPLPEPVAVWPAGGP